MTQKSVPKQPPASETASTQVEQIEKYLYPLVLGLLTMGLAWFIWQSNIVTIDWWLRFYPAGQNWLNPYSGEFHYVYPPWLAAILAPFTLADENTAKSIFALLSMVACGYTIKAAKGNLITAILFFLTIPSLYIFFNGQVDAIPVLGVGLALSSLWWVQVIGMILIATKPQLLGLAIPIILWSSAEWKKQIVAGAIFTAVTFMIWGNWPLAAYLQVEELYTGHNVSIFPWGVPIGLWLVYKGFKDKEFIWGAAATIFFVPYFNSYSLMALFAILFPRLPWWVNGLILIASWVIFLGFGCVESMTVCAA